MAAGSSPWKPSMAALKCDASSGCCSRNSYSLTPSAFSNPVSPVRTLWRTSPQADHHQPPAANSTVERAAPGASGLERGPQRRQGVASLAVRAEQPDARERPQYPAKGRGVGARRGGDLLGGPGAILQHVRDPEFRRNIDRAGDPVAGRQANDLCLRRETRCRGSESRSGVDGLAGGGVGLHR